MNNTPPMRGPSPKVAARRAKVAAIYHNHTNQQIAEMMGCTVARVRSDALALGLKKPRAFINEVLREAANRQHAIPDEVVEEMGKLYPRISNRDMCKRFGKSRTALHRLATKHGWKNQEGARRNAETKARKAVVALHYKTKTNEEIAKMLGVSPSQVSRDASTMGLKKPLHLFAQRLRTAKPQVEKPRARDARIELTDQQLLDFDAAYPFTRNSDLAATFSVSKDAVIYLARKRKLQKDRDAVNRWMSETNKKTYSERSPARPKPKPFQVVPVQGSTPAQLLKIAQERFVYAPGALPWRAERMHGPVYVPPPMTYRGQA